MGAGRSYGERHGRAFGGWLVLMALGYAVFHHAGTIFASLGDVGGTGTRWADWVDIATPFVVTGAVAGALRGGGASRSVWALFWFAAIVYTEGHGIHLAANSIGNAALRQSEPTYLWDEHVGHYLWYAGFFLLVAALAMALADRRMRGGMGAHVLAMLVGITTFTNVVEGQTAWFGLAVAAVLVCWGLLTRDGMGRLLITAYGTALVLLVGFGLWQQGFPEFTTLGWI